MARTKKSTKATKKTVKKAPARKVTKKVVKKVVKKVTKKPVKKTVKKAVKKTTTKKPKAAKKTNKKDLVQADGQTSFWMTDGQVLATLIDLRDALDAMDREVYEYHATGEQNDFARWVCDVLYDDKCASDLTKAKTQSSAKTAVVRHLKSYTY